MKNLTDKDGEAQELDESFFSQAKRGRPAMLEEERKSRITMYLDKDIVDYFKEGGKGWQTRMNDALRKELG